METMPFVAIMRDSDNFAEEILNFLVYKLIIYMYSKLNVALIRYLEAKKSTSIYLKAKMVYEVI